MNPPRVLFVDDESNVLSALQRQFRKQFEVHTALGGAKALQLIASAGPFAVIVSDMRMPAMSGLEFLKEARKSTPDSVRLMLTGNADQKTAMDAVNEGKVFSFLTKPCPPEVMFNAINRAVAQHHLITAERDLLENTLNGSIRLLTDMLSMVAPDCFGRAVAVREMARSLADVIQPENAWNLELAAMLGSLAAVTLPPQTLAGMLSGEELQQEEQQMAARLPEIGRNLLNHIPRLERVADIVYYQQKHFDGSGFPADDLAGEDIPLESRILKILGDLQVLKARGVTQADAMQQMAGLGGVYDQVILELVAVALSTADTASAESVLVEVTLAGLQPGHVLVTDIETIDGKLLFAAGHKITLPIKERLINYQQIARIKEPIRVLGANAQPEGIVRQ